MESTFCLLFSMSHVHNVFSPNIQSYGSGIQEKSYPDPAVKKKPETVPTLEKNLVTDPAFFFFRVYRVELTPIRP